ncbi:hypothetical protein [Draconibacterium mangrovi]|uniref:hypothetical protein n=1 Tax=Draconibacterium mangrovi TaxID=2697469 RepID=UPI0013D07906|nr:hypothetical protein [Draconibacterium mangrovi]
MDTTTRKATVYLDRDLVESKKTSGIYTSTKKDINPFISVYGKERNSFIVDWQVCDEEYLEK